MELVFKDILPLIKFLFIKNVYIGIECQINNRKYPEQARFKF